MALPIALFLASSAVKAGSQIWQGRVAKAQSEAEAQMAERNAQTLELDAQAQEEKTKFDLVRAVLTGERIQGALTAQLGASGARLDVGAPLDLLSAQASELDLDRMLIGFEGTTKAARLRDQAGIVRAGGDMALQRGKNAELAGFIGAGSSLLRDFATAKKEVLFQDERKPRPKKIAKSNKVGSGSPIALQNLFRSGTTLRS